MRTRRQVLEDAGIRFKLNCDIGRDIQAKDLLGMHDALFFGTGAYTPVEANLPGQDAGGIVPALDFLIGQTVHLFGMDLPAYPHIDLAGQRVLVLGGGDTAMDCVRTAVRQRAKSVTCVYRRDRQNMPGSRKEVEHAIKEGVKFEFNALPLELARKGKRVDGLRIARTRLVEDADGGRARPEVIPGSEEVLPASALIFAFGYRASPPEWLGSLGVALHDNGLVRVGTPLPGQTSNPAIFAAGDNVRGADLVVTAIADARAAAKSMLQYLQARQPQRKTA